MHATPWPTPEYTRAHLPVPMFAAGHAPADLPLHLLQVLQLLWMRVRPDAGRESIPQRLFVKQNAIQYRHLMV